MKILHFADIDKNKSNGPTLSVTCLSNAMNNIDNVSSCVLSLSALKEMKKDFELNDYIDIDLFIFHGVWIPIYWSIGKVLASNNKKYVIVPRSNLVKSSHRKSWFKKKIAFILAVKKFIRSASAIHFLNNNERCTSLNFGAPSFIAPNGFLPPSKFSSDKDYSYILPCTLDRNIISFIGRIDIYHKGLDSLIKAVSLIKPILIKTKTTIFICGDDPKKQSVKLKNLIKSCNCGDVIYIYPHRVDGDAKSWLLNQSVGFIHTSRYEGEPLAVLEAIAYGLPVLVTRGTNMYDYVASNKLGVVSENDSDSISIAMSKFISDFTNAKKKINNQAILSRSWDTVALETLMQIKRITSIES